MKGCQAERKGRPDLLLHQQYPTRKRGEATNRGDLRGKAAGAQAPEGNTVGTEYDSEGRALSTWTPVGPLAAYAHDAVGQMIAFQNGLGQVTTYHYDAANELLVVTPPSPALPTTHTWDAAGNLHVENTGGALTTYTWDDDNKLVGVSHLDGRIETFTYDASGLRRRKETPEAGRIFVWQGQNLLVETDTSLVVQAEYTDLPGMWGGLVSQPACGGGTNVRMRHVCSL